jgi:hypothetical protein
MPRPQRSLVALCIAVVALAPLLHGIDALAQAVLDPQWVLLPDEVLVCVCSLLEPDPEQPLALVSLLPSRAPPPQSLA